MKITRMTNLIIVFLLLLISQCFAMQMSEPLRLGGFSGAPLYPDWLPVDGASQIVLGENRKNRVGLLDGGMARFGNGVDALYVHFDRRKIPKQTNSDCKPVGIGGYDIGNTFPMESYVTDVYKINTDEGIIFYAIRECGDSLECDWIILGCRQDGRFVKYLDTREFSKKYYTLVDKWMYLAYSPNIIIKNDTLVIDCYLCRYGENNSKKIGRFCLFWDSNAQWFGIEKL